jgi:hypothetical protein
MTDTRPAWLRPYALVTGKIPSAPLDLPQRMEGVYRLLQNAGWRVVVKSIGTDFSGPLGIPVPREQPIELYLYRPEKFSASDAQNALTSALLASGIGYSPIGSWLGEIVDHVVVPTARDVGQAPQKATETIVWWVLGGLAAFVLVARATAPAADSYARLAANLRGERGP